MVISTNAFTGLIDFTFLHEGIVAFDAVCSKLTGFIELKHFPKSMEDLSLNNNAFTGRISLQIYPTNWKFSKSNEWLYWLLSHRELVDVALVLPPGDKAILMEGVDASAS